MFIKKYLVLIILIIFSRPANCEIRKIIYSFDKEFPPFSYTENENITGFDIEIIEAIFLDSSFELTKKPLLWEEAQRELAEGNIDIISGIDKTEERLKIYDFSDSPISFDKVTVFVKENSNISNSKDLKGKTVAVQKSTSYQEPLQKIDDIQLVFFDSEKDGLLALANGNTDAFVGTDKTASFNIKKLGIKGIKGLSTPLELSFLYSAVRKGNRDLLNVFNKSLKKLKKNGIYDKIYRKWFVQELTSLEIDSLLQNAKEASKNAYAPYSNYNVGAAVITKSGKIYSGCNIENSLYGLTSSALKVAILKAASEADTDIKAVICILPDGRLTPPAADERQIVYEFGRGILVVVEEEKGIYKTEMISQFLPFAFELR